jgi:hypothetical protein
MGESLRGAFRLARRFVRIGTGLLHSKKSGEIDR